MSKKPIKPKRNIYLYSLTAEEATCYRQHKSACDLLNLAMKQLRDLASVSKFGHH